MPDSCPVCLAGDTAPASCPRCGWTLNTAWCVGPPDHARFATRLTAAQQTFDLGRAVVAAGFPERGDLALLDRLQRHVRGGPPGTAQLAAARAGAARPAPRRAVERRPMSGLVLDIGLDGVSATRFVPDLDGTAIERAEREHWPWSALLPGLPADTDERRLVLAGGIGPAADAVMTAAETLSRAFAAALGGERPNVLRTALAGWSIPDLAVGLLRGDRPGVTVIEVGEHDLPPTATRLGRRMSAFAAVLGPQGQIWTAAGFPDGTVRALLPQDGDVRVHDGRVSTIDIGPDGVVVTGGHDGSVRACIPATGSRPRPVAQHDNWVNAVARRGEVVFSLGDDGRLRRSPLSPGGALAGAAAYPVDVGWAAASAIGASADGSLVAHGGSDGRVVLREGWSGNRRGSVSTRAAVVALAVLSDDRIAAATADGRVSVIEPDGTDRVRPVTTAAGSTACLGAGPAGEVVIGCESGRVLLWQPDAGDGSAVAVGTHTEPVRGVALLPDGRVVSAGADGLIRTWRGAGTTS